MKTLVVLFALTIAVQPAAHEDVLEPSVLNEVDHALSRAPTNAPAAAALPAFPAEHPFHTNGLSRTAVALRLVSAQAADGRWMAVYGGKTNDLTSVAIQWLEWCRE